MYKHIRISFHTEKHRKAIERLKPLSGHWRSNYVAASIESYDKKDNGQAARDAGNGPTGIDEPTPIYKRIWISLLKMDLNINASVRFKESSGRPPVARLMAALISLLPPIK